MSIGSPGLWIGFILFVIAMLAVDLGIFHKKSHVVGFREALAWSCVWVALALVFGAGVWYQYGPDRGMEFLTGYLIEKSLSVDNIFVFVIIFATLRIPEIYQHRVLFWGILSALVMRAAMILGGAALLERFHWLIYLFGAFLILTGIKMLLQSGNHGETAESLPMRVARRLIPSTSRMDGDHFFTVENGRRVATPLFMALILVEITDVIFAVDSIPAIFAITRDSFIVFTSNIFAILGLRSLYFLLGGVVDKFRYLKVGLAAILVFVGIKMSAIDIFKIPPIASLAVIVAILAISVVASLRAAAGRSTTPPAAPSPGTDRS